MVKSDGSELDEDWVREVANEAEEFVWKQLNLIRQHVSPGGSGMFDFDGPPRAKEFKRLVNELAHANSGVDSPLVSAALPQPDSGETMTDTILRLAALTFIAGVVVYLIRRCTESDTRKEPTLVASQGRALQPARFPEPGGAFAVVWMSGTMKPEELECLQAANAEKKLTVEALEIVKRCYKSRYLRPADLDKLTAAGAGRVGPMTGEQALPGYLLGLIGEQQGRLASHGDRFGPPLRTVLKAAIDERRPPSFEVHSASDKTVDEFGFVVV